MEFVSNDKEGNEDMGINPTISEIQNGGLCRTKKAFERLLKKSNILKQEYKLKFDYVKDDKVDLGIVQGHHVLHVRRITI